MHKKKNLLFFLVLLIGFAAALYLGPSVFPNRETSLPEGNTNLDKKEVNKDRYIFIGDTGTGNENQYVVADAIKNYCDSKQDCAAIFILGDVIYPEGVVGINDIAFIEKFESPFRDIDLPFYILYGNHDYLGCTQCYLDYAERSDKWNMSGRYYSIVTDMNDSFFALDTENMDDDQLEWLTKKLETSENDLKIVLGHRPIVSHEASKYREDWNGRRELQDTMCDEADLYISGHSHLMEDVGRVGDCNLVQLISGAGGAYIRGIHEPFEGEFYYSGYGFLSLEVDESKAEYEFLNLDQEVIHTNKIQN